METEKSFSVEIPDGYEIDKERSTFERIVFKKIDPDLPESWEEFCSMTKKSGFFITATCNVLPMNSDGSRLDPSFDKNILESVNDCNAHLALVQLHRLRDCYRQGWDETMSGGMGWVVYVDYRNNLDRIGCSYGKGFLSFQNKEMADEFAKNFKDLILQAKKLLR